MVTLGYIEEITTNSNLFKVRVPIFEQAGINDKVILEANLAYNPGNLNGYVVGDCVVIGFLDNRMGKPIILSKLYTGIESDATNFSFTNSLTVTEKATLPGNTSIGDISMQDLLVLHDNLQHLEDRIKNIDDKDMTNVSVVSNNLRMPIIAVIGQDGHTISPSESVKIAIKIVSGELEVGDEIVLSAICYWQDSNVYPHRNYSKQKHRTICKYTITRADLNSYRYVDQHIILFPITKNSVSTLDRLRYSYSYGGNTANIKYIRIRRRGTISSDRITTNICPIRLNCSKPSVPSYDTVYVSIGGF